ncbi:hypothetical protein HKD37_14G040054 [Glycine soja]
MSHQGYVFSGSPVGDQDFGHEPPDDKGGSSFVQEKVSFCDKVFHNKEKPPVRPKVNSLKHNLATIEYENSNPLKPMVHIADSMFEGLCTSWQNALVVKLLGKRIVGSPVKVDVKALDARRGSFSRVCVEVELKKLVVGRVGLKDH